MLAELDVVVFLKTSDPLDVVAQRVFGSLGSGYWPAEHESAEDGEYDAEYEESPEGGEEVALEAAGEISAEAAGTGEDDVEATAYEASGLGFDALLLSNQGDQADPEFLEYPYGLQITSRFWCVELDTVDLEGPLSEYFARELAFDLNMQTATEILLETTEEVEVFEARAFRRNPQYRLDQAPTVPKVFVVEQRQYEQAFDDGLDWEESEEPEATIAPQEEEGPAEGVGENV